MVFTTLNMDCASVLEQLYGALIAWEKPGSLAVTSTSLAFFRHFYSSVTTGTYDSCSSTYSSLASAVWAFADGILEINTEYTPFNGALSEQFDKSSGSSLSAAGLRAMPPRAWARCSPTWWRRA
uniref:Yersiniabactin-iron ABC transporter permease ATP-binding protein YbtQ n=1 Tax=Ganoderma boninense TaxID=34458 RepID=A0A5K1K0B6_9APHY|nr:Yersiniabactin-iron ABC transporter permease ATP-binding protein YbtQ [Ganoderma boninense]